MDFPPRDELPPSFLTRAARAESSEDIQPNGRKIELIYIYILVFYIHCILYIYIIIIYIIYYYHIYIWSLIMFLVIILVYNWVGSSCGLITKGSLWNIQKICWYMGLSQNQLPGFRSSGRRNHSGIWFRCDRSKWCAPQKTNMTI